MSLLLEMREPFFKKKKILSQQPTAEQIIFGIDDGGLRY